MSPYLEIFRVLMGPRPVRWHALRASENRLPAPKSELAQIDSGRNVEATHRKAGLTVRTVVER